MNHTHHPGSRHPVIRRVLVFISLLAAWPMLAGAQPGRHPDPGFDPARGNPADITGILEVVEVCYTDGRDNVTLYQVTEEKTGKVHKVRFQKEPGHGHRTGERVRIRGRDRGLEISVPEADESIQAGMEVLAPAPPPTVGLSPTPSVNFIYGGGTTGSTVVRQTLVMLVNYSNSQPWNAVTHIPEFTNKFFATTGASVNTVYLENTYGAVGFAGKVIVCNIAAPNGPCDTGAWGSQADAQAVLQGENPNSYAHKVYIVSGACGWAGLASVGGNWSMDYYTDGGTICHELGHNLGFHHSSTQWNNTSGWDEYGDGSDFMGGSYDWRHNNGPHKMQMGWLAATTVTTAGTYQIGPIEEVPSSIPHPQLLKIASNSPPNGWPYYLSYKQSVGFDAGVGSGYNKGVSIHRFNGGNTAAVSVLADGQTFTDSATGMSVRQISHDANSVTVTLVPFVLVAQPFTVMVTSAQLAAHTPVTVDVIGNSAADPLTVTGYDAVSTQGGAVTLSGNQLIYTPAGVFSGNDTFGYTVTDLLGNISSSVVTVVPVTQPAYNWDANGVTAGSGGTGTWNTSSFNWDNGAGQWPGSGTTNWSLFGGTAGTVSIASGGVSANGLGFKTTGYVVQENTLTLNGSAPGVLVESNVDATISSAVAGAAGLVKSGNGKLTLGAANNYSGGTTVSMGTLAANHAAALGAVPRNVTLGDANSGVNPVNLMVDTGVAATVSLASLQTTNLATSPTITLNTGSALGGNTSGLTITTLNLNGNVPLTVRATNTGGHSSAQDIAYRLAGGGIAAGNTALILDGTAAGLRVSFPNGSVANDFTGDVIIKGGVSTQNLTYNGNTAANQNLGFRNNNVTVSSGSTWTVVWGGETLGALNGSGNVSLNCQKALNNIGLTLGGTGADGSHSGTISGGFGVKKTGSGSQTLAGNNGFSGGMTLSGGALIAGHDSAFGSGTLTLGGGSLTTSGVRTFANPVVVAADTVTNVYGYGGGSNYPKFTGAFTGSGTFKNSNPSGGLGNTFIQGDISNFTGTIWYDNYDVANASNNFQFTGTTAASYDGSKAGFYLTGAKTASGRGQMIVNGSGGTFRMGELSGPGGIITGGGALEIGARNTDTDFDGVIGTTNALTKVGTGRLTLAGSNTYTGTTTVNGGTLRVNGSLAAGSAVTVNASATLGGTGTIKGPVTLDSGATLAAGDANIGTLTIQNSLTLSPTATVTARINKTGTVLSADKISMTGATGIAFNGTLTVTASGEPFAAGDKFTLFSKTAGTFTGSFATMQLPGPGPGLSWDISGLTVDGSIGVMDLPAVPTPAFSLAAGNYFGARSVTITCAQFGATIYYTTDGSPPTAGSAVYTGAISVPVDSTMTLQAIATAPGSTDSAVASATYATSSATAATWINPSGGSWPVTGNWLNAAVCQGGGITALFNTLALTGQAGVTLDGPVTVGGLAFKDLGNLYSWSLNPGTGGTLTLAGGQPTIAVENQTATLAVDLAGTDGLVKAGTGTLTLSGANTYSGGTTISQGMLVANKTSALGATTGGLMLGDANTGANSVELKVDAGVTAPVVLAAVNTSDYGTSQTITLNPGSALGGNASALTTTINLDGNVPLTVKATNTGGHSTAQDLYCRLLGTGIPAGTTALILDGTARALRTSQLGDTSAASNFTGDVLIKGAVSTQGRTYLTQTAGNQNLGFLNNNVTVASGATWTIVWGGETAGALNGSGNVVFNNQNALNNIGLTLGNNNASGSHAGVISGGFGLSKVGGGTQSLAGANSYSGATTVNGGTLALNNTTGSATGGGAVTVKSAATLAGTGSMSGSATIESGAFIAPGNAGTGTLTIASATLAGTYQCQLGASAGDRLAVTGTLTVSPGAAIVVSTLAAPTAASYTIASYSSLTGSLPAVTGVPSGYTVDTATAGTIKLVATPFQQWMSTFTSLTNPADLLPDADPDRDGISNVIEFVTNGNPAGGNQSNLPRVATTGANLVFIYTRRDDAEYLNPRVEFNTGLQGPWTTCQDPGNCTIAVQENGSEPDIVTVSIPRNGNPLMFARLVADQ